MAMNMTHLKANIASTLAPELRAAALEGVRTVLTEANTDTLIKRLVTLIKAKMPVYLRWLPLGTILDRLMPDALLKVFEEALS